MELDKEDRQLIVGMMTKRQIIKGLYEYFLQTPEKKWMAIERRWEKIVYLSGVMTVWITGAITNNLGLVLFLFWSIILVLGVWYFNLKK